MTSKTEFLLVFQRKANEAPEYPATIGQERSLSLEEIATLRRFYNGTVLAFKEMRAKARAQREAPPSYPPMVEEMQALVERLSVAGQ